MSSQVKAASPAVTTLSASTAPRGQLALALQEALTAVVRLREGRQVPNDAHAFRAQMKTLLAQADQDSRRMGYPPEFVKISVYSVIAYLDETVLGTPGPLSAAWVGRPLQEEVFGDTVAGETFFRYVEELLTRQDSAYVADVLEVALLCLLLGFRGRYATSDGNEIRSLSAAVAEKIRRIRGGLSPLSPRGAPPTDEVVARTSDRWLRMLSLGLLGSAVVTVLLFGLLRLLYLRGGVDRIVELVERIVA
jgi:type VI secretion system protein ImpK